MRYFAWIDSQGYMNGQMLLSEEKISALLSLLDQKNQVFSSIQLYDEGGNIQSCPIYMDLDGESDQVLADTRYLVYLIQSEFNIGPEIYFSGNKGFHLIIPFIITHPQCHFIVKNLVTSFSNTVVTLDKRVYRPRSLFRLENSPASRRGFYKIRLTTSELNKLTMLEIKYLARSPRNHNMPQVDIDRLKESTRFDWLIENATNKLPKYETIQDIERHINDFDIDMTDCVRKIFTTAPINGDRNHSVFILAKFFKSCGIPCVDAISMMLKQPHYNNINEDHSVHIEAVFKSVYKSSQPVHMGCKTSSDGDLMRKYCDPLCWHNPEFSKLGFK